MHIIDQAVQINIVRRGEGLGGRFTRALPKLQSNGASFVGAWGVPLCSPIWILHCAVCIMLDVFPEFFQRVLVDVARPSKPICLDLVY